MSTTTTTAAPRPRDGATEAFDVAQEHVADIRNGGVDSVQASSMTVITLVGRGLMLGMLAIADSIEAASDANDQRAAIARGERYADAESAIDALTKAREHLDAHARLVRHDPNVTTTHTTLGRAVDEAVRAIAQLIPPAPVTE